MQLVYKTYRKNASHQITQWTVGTAFKW